MKDYNKILNEELQRIKELVSYDKSKTLMEQGSADINMDRTNQQQLSQAPESTKTAPAPQTDIKSKSIPVRQSM